MPISRQACDGRKPIMLDSSYQTLELGRSSTINNRCIEANICDPRVSRAHVKIAGNPLNLEVIGQNPVSILTSRSGKKVLVNKGKTWMLEVGDEVHLISLELAEKAGHSGLVAG